MSDTPRETLLEFPTSFPIKALGKDVPEFHAAVVEIIAVHAQFDLENDVRLQPSNKGNFVSITVTLQAESQQQLDTIYQSLHDHELVLMVF
jgi:putative lipoic acid-binding regulatory protein